MKTNALLASGLLISLAPIAANAAKPVPLDPNAAYVLVEIGTLDDAMLKGVKMPGSLILARYDAAKGDVRGGTLSPDTALPKGVAPRVTIMEKPLVKTKTSRLYLIKLEPDTWVIEGASGTAFSLGSAQFSIGRGQVIDLGVVKPVVEWLDGEGPKSMMGGMMGAALFGSMKPKEIRPVRLDWRPRSGTDLPVPTALVGRTFSAGQYTYGAKFGNYLGGLVNRIDGRAGRDKAAAIAAPVSAPAAP
jgi:hypothetical protein